MNQRRLRSRAGILWVALTAVLLGATPAHGLEQQNEQLFRRLQEAHELDEPAMARVREIFRKSGFVGQGNPAIVQHPQSPDECRATRRKASRPADDLQSFRRICRSPHMAPLYDPQKQRADEARVCIDQYEFPGVPCEYPVVWVRAHEAAQLCKAVGKRLCDAHEWEGACQGALGPPDYRFDLARGVSPDEARRRMRSAHNQANAADKRWSYGPQYQEGVCASASRKTPGCAGGGWKACGSNTYPAGAFPRCRSPLGVYDLNGNAAEHMNLPLNESQMASRGSEELGYTEMKGSWFIFDTYRAHEDWCRWRAPAWHGTRVMDRGSHSNYHLGFRCCKTVAEE